jgi:PAS domain S-box-containing protein
MDLKANLTMINQRFLQIGGYFYDEVIGHSVLEFVQELKLDFLLAGIKKFMKTKKLDPVEYPIKKKDGTVFPMEMAISLLTNDKGKPTGIMGVGRDITERKRDEEALRKSEESFRCTFEAIPDPAYIWTRQDDGRFILSKFNRAATRITKGKIKDFIGIEAEKLFADNPDFVTKIRLAIDKGKPQYSEVLYKYQTTEESKWLQVDYVKTAENSVMVITKDVTDRKRDFRELLESKALIEAVLENVPLMIFIKEATDLRFVIFNRAGEELLGRDRKNLLGKNNLDLFPAEQAAFFMAKDREVLADGTDMLDIPEEPIMTAKKGQRLLHTRKICIRGADGTTKYLLGISEDITERKEAEAKLLAYQEQLRALTSEIMLVEERERRRIASELHDQIGQNLALCKLKVAALEKNLEDTGMKGELSVVRRLLECSIQDARSLIFDLSPPVLYELGFAAALEWLAERMQEQFHVPIEFENRSKELELESDQQVILFQVARELLMNVGKHSRAGQAKVILAHEGPFLKVQVNDDGVGFDASRIFAPSQLNSGFGFFSMRERVNYLGGSLDVRSRPGQGSQIILKIPLKDSATAAGKEKS